MEELAVLIDKLLAVRPTADASDEDRTAAATARHEALALLDIDAVEASLRSAANDMLASGDETASTLESLSAMADALDDIAAERTERADALATKEAEKAALAARFTAEGDTTDPDVPATADDPDATLAADAVEGDAPVTEPAPETTPAVTEPVTAAAPAPRPDLSALRQFQPPTPTIVPEEIVPDPVRVAVTAAVDVPGYAVGSELPDARAAAEAIIARRRSLGTSQGVSMERVPVVRFDYSDQLETLSEDPAKAGLQLMDIVRRASEPNALTASGGFIAPAEVIYDFVKVNRPTDLTQDWLPTVGATRGAITFPVSPDIRNAFTANLTRSYSNADDIAATHKLAAVITGPSFSTCTVGAQYEILQFGNFGTRAYPEWVEHWTGLSMDAHAHKVSNKLIGQMVAASNLAVAVGPNGGAASTLFSNISLAAADLRHDLRMDKDAPLELVLPSWIPDLLQSDLFRSSKGLLEETFGITDADIDKWLGNLDVNVRWVTDWQDTSANANVGATVWPATVQYLLYPPGTFIKLDMGVLDLGIVRDSTLNATNDYHIFVESFESACKRGIESRLYTASICATGAFSRGIALNCAGIPENDS